MKARQSYRPFRSFCALLSLIVVSSLSQMASAQCDAFAGIAPEDPVNICGTEPFCLFDYLETDGTPIQTDGAWTGPSGWTWDATLCASFEPSTHPPGDYTYTVVGTDGCTDSATITMAYADDGIIGNFVYCGGGAINLFTLICIPQGLPLTGTWYYGGISGYPSIGSLVPFGIVDSDTAPGGEFIYQYYDANNCFTTVGINLILTTGQNGGCETSIDYCLDQGQFCPIDHLGCNPDFGGDWIAYDTDYSYLGFLDGFGCVDASDIDQWGDSLIFQYVLGDDFCPTLYTDLHVTFHAPVNTGVETMETICQNGPPVLLESLLDDGGEPITEGLTWTDISSPSTGIPLTNPLDPSVYPPNTTLHLQYSGGQAGTSCETATSLVLTILPAIANAGNGGTVEICSSSSAINLLQFVTDPWISGIWVGPPPFNGGSFYNPELHVPGEYYYIVASTCAVDTATVTVIELDSPNAGEDGSAEVCATSGDISHDALFGYLGGEPEAGGVWAFQETGEPVPDPLDVSDLCGSTIDLEYSLSNAECTSTSVLELEVMCPLNAGPDVTIYLCEDPALNFTLLPDAAADAGGTFNDNNFQQVSANSGVYTYTVPGSGVCPPDVANYTVNIEPEITYSLAAICEPNQTEYYVELEVLTGEYIEIIDNGNGLVVQPAQEGVHMLGPIPDGVNFSFTIVSANSCPNVVVSGISPNCVCPASATITSANETICEGECFDLVIEFEGSPPYDFIVFDGTEAPMLTSFESSIALNFCPTSTTTYNIVHVNDVNCTGTASGVVTVSVESPPNAGEDGSFEFCEDQGIVIDLNQYLDPMADVGGTFNLNLFSQIPDNSGQYVYVVSGFSCPADTAEYLVEIEPDTDGDGICDSDEIVGCQNPSAANYNPLATDPGPCELDGGYEDVLTDLVQQSGELSDGFSGISLWSNEAQSSTFKIYPNPARDYFLLESTSVSITEVIVMSPDGKVVRLVSPETTGELKIDTSELASGLYLVKTRLEDGNLVSRKVLIEN